MNWLSFSILSYLLLGLHVALRPFIAWHDATPNLVLLAVVFVAINASREPALLGCFLLGALQDLFTAGPMGVHAFAYGLAGLYIQANQRSIHREHFVTHFAMTLAGGVIVSAWAMLHNWLYYKLHPLPVTTPGLGLWQQVLSILYSAALAPIAIGVLQRSRRVFAFRQPKATINLRARN